MGIELAVAEMICLFDKHMKQGKLLDYLPEFCRQFLILERIRLGSNTPALSSCWKLVVHGASS